MCVSLNYYRCFVYSSAVYLFGCSRISYKIGKGGDLVQRLFFLFANVEGSVISKVVSC